MLRNQDTTIRIVQYQLGAPNVFVWRGEASANRLVEKNNKDGRLEVHFILRPELLSQNTHSRCIQRSMMRQTMPQAHLCRIECVENHIVRAKYKQHRVRSSESYLLARASTQPRGSEDQSACQSQRTVFIMCCRGVADFEFSDSFQTLDFRLQICSLAWCEIFSARHQ